MGFAAATLVMVALLPRRGYWGALLVVLAFVAGGVLLATGVCPRPSSQVDGVSLLRAVQGCQGKWRDGRDLCRDGADGALAGGIGHVAGQLLVGRWSGLL